MKTLSELVGDWGGFEKLVATMHETGEVTVEHDVQLIGLAGTTRQIDVVVRHRQGLYEHLVLVECKYWRTAVTRLHVDALALAVRDLNAARGVIFSVEGFQEGAVKAAAAYGIDLFKVREPTAEEWGLPGRIIDMYLWTSHCALGSLGPFEVDLEVGTPGPRVELKLELGNDGTRTPVVGSDKTLEELLVAAVHKAGAAIRGKARVLGSGGDCKWRRRARFNWTPPTPLVVMQGTHRIRLRRVEGDVGVQVSQMHIVHDRAQRRAFVLAVEDCVRGGVSLASRENMEEVTALMATQRAPVDQSDVMHNGSIMDVWLADIVPFTPFERLRIGDEELES